MAKSQTVKLNLVITAQDQAKAVFEEFAATLTEQIDQIKSKLDEAFNMGPMLADLQKMSSEMKTALDGINPQSSADRFDAAMAAMTAATDGVKTAISDLETTTRVSMEQTAAAVQEQTIKMTENFAKVGSSVRHIEKGFNGMQAQFAGQQIAMVGKKITDFFGAASGAAIEFNQNISNVASSFIAQGESAAFVNAHLQKMNAYALELGSNGFFSANQVADAMNVMAKQGIAYQTVMGGALKAADDVAAANQEDLSTTANVISDIVHEMGTSLLSQYGNMGNAMSHVGDIMTTALHHSRLSMNDFLNTMKYAGPQASALGLHFSDLGAAIATLGQHGIRGTQAGTTLRRMLTNLTPASKAAATEMKNLGFITKSGANVFYDATGHLKSFADVQKILHDRLTQLSPEQEQFALKTIFGMYALSGATAITNASTKAYASMTAAMTRSGEAHDILREKEQGAGFQMQKLHASFDTMMKAIGTMFVPAIVALAKVFDRVTSAVTKFVETHPRLAKIIAVIVSLIGSILLIGGTVLAAVGTFAMFVTAIGEIGISFAALMSTLGIALGVIAVVVAAVIAFRDAWKHNFLDIQGVTHAVWNGLVTLFRDAWNMIGPPIIQGIKAVSAYWKSIWPELRQVFVEVWHAIEILIAPFAIYFMALFAGIRASWTSFWRMIGYVFKASWDLFVGLVKIGWHIVSGVFKVALDLLTGHWGKAWTDFKAIFSNVWNDFRQLFGNLVKDALGFGRNFIQMLIKGIEGEIGSLVRSVSGIANKIKGFLGFHSPTKEGPLTDSDQYMPNMMRMFQSGIEQQLPSLKVSLNAIASTVKGAVNPATNGTSGVVNNYATTTNLTAAGTPRTSINPNITVNVTGAGNAKDAGEQIARVLRTQLTMVSA